MGTQETRVRKVEVPLSDELVEALGGVGEDLSLRAREAIVLHFFQSGKVSRGYAAKLLGMSLWEFYDLLAKHDLPVTHYKEGEVEAEVEAADEFLHRQGR